MRKTRRNWWRKRLACLIASGALCASASSLFVQEMNVTCRNGNALLKKQVKPLLDDNFLQDSGKWEAFTNYEDILVATFGGDHLGTKGFLIKHGQKPDSDTAFEMTSKPFAVTAGSEFILTIAGRASVEMKNSNGCGELYHNEVKWLDKDGKVLPPTPIVFSLGNKGVTEQKIYGKVPKNAVSAVIRIGADNPNIVTTNYLLFTRVAFESEAKGSPFATTGSFISKPWKISEVGNGTLEWNADLPAGTAFSLQLSTAPDDKGIPGEWTPFAGPGGDVNAVYKQSRVALPAFPAGHTWIRYRAIFNGTNASTPVLKSIKLGNVSDDDWAGLDREPPKVDRTSLALNENPMAPVTFKFEDNTSINWKDISILLDGDDITSSMKRNGNVLTYVPEAPGLAPAVERFEKIKDWKCISNFRNCLEISQLKNDPAVLRVIREDGETDTSFCISSPECFVTPETDITVSFDIRTPLKLENNPQAPPFRLIWLDADRKKIGSPVLIPVKCSESWQTCSLKAKAPANAASVMVQYGFDHPDFHNGLYLDLRNPLMTGHLKKLPKKQEANFHLFTVNVSDLSGNAIQKRFNVLVDKPVAKNIVTIRKDGAVLIDGKPFFPIGLYAVWKRAFNHNSFDEAFDGLRKGGFNLAHTYSSTRSADFREFMDAADRHGVKLYIASGQGANMMDASVYLNDVCNERNHPAVLSWYLADDTASHVNAKEVRELHDAIHEIDNAHITCQADPVGAPGNSRYRAFVNSTDCFLPEIYPVRKGVSMEMTVPQVIEDMKIIQEDLAASGNPAKTIWPIIQYFQGWSGWTRFPTYDELRAMSFLSIIHGGNGITWYTYGGWGDNHGVCDTPEIWATMCRVSTQLHDLEEVFLTECYEKAAAPVIVSGPAKDAMGFDSISVLFKRVGERQFLICANSAFKEVKATLKADGVKKGKVWFEDRNVTLTNGAFTDVFKPYDVHVYELTK